MLREQWGDEPGADGGGEVGDGEGDGGPHRGLAGGRPDNFYAYKMGSSVQVRLAAAARLNASNGVTSPVLMAVERWEMERVMRTSSRACRGKTRGDHTALLARGPSPLDSD
ncbi:hypothetical protein C4D60_Mb10t21490 [Musa balbisiana]|uniref:Uncharacterized protein n=1 Tax=Musa balbisiana TaxID=52838 RepID=A0A4S8IYV0_MUSBA|nr:hypothetical protein C4D60_Mb10t21490 [Musa balbisiana]